MLPFVLMPQVCWPPAVIAVNVAVGALSWPKELSPQHVTVPSIRSAQVWLLPTATLANGPVGGVEFPARSLPQQVRLPVGRTAQEWLPPASSTPFVSAAAVAIDGATATFAAPAGAGVVSRPSPSRKADRAERAK